MQTFDAGAEKYMWLQLDHVTTDGQELTLTNRHMSQMTTASSMKSTASSAAVSAYSAAAWPRRFDEVFLPTHTMTFVMVGTMASSSACVGP